MTGPWTRRVCVCVYIYIYMTVYHMEDIYSKSKISATVKNEVGLNEPCHNYTFNLFFL